MLSGVFSPLGILASLVVLGALVLATLFQLKRRQRAAWEAFAKAHGLSIAERRMEVQGRYQGRPLLLATGKRGGVGGKKRHTVTVLRLDLEGALPADLLLEHERPEDKLPGAATPREESLGDAELDAAFQVEGLAPEARPVLLDPNVRQRLLGLKGHRRVSLKGGWLQVEQRGVPASATALEALLRAPHDLARAITEAAPALPASNALDAPPHAESPLDEELPGSEHA
ncbi:hypothetical protein D7W79_22660 [Corallococcus exercitus]|uniref:Uncharacterized protein n=1 Tax=Corallococcus exercitus TaxID=2316736 RepID=A0A3A8I855_9BACT|nr:hypothetical protein [Corallococcus exercitus]NOK33592.1 hypothetical protein [Corallococcus exercitus]RKG74531.1 hypothetical protein D7W79_22660 [Corallococcus exercitus]